MKFSQNIIFIKTLFKFILNDKDLTYLCSLSSLSSQLGLAISLQDYLKSENEFKLNSKLFLILHFPTSIDSKCKNEIDFKNLVSKLKFQHSNEFQVLKIKNNIDKISLYIFILIKILFRKNFLKKPLFLIQTRPYWLLEQFKKFPYIKNLNFDKYFLIGDGFLSLELQQKPFWLNKKEIKKGEIDLEKFSNIFYLYNVNKSYDKYINLPIFRRLPPNFIRKSIRSINENNLIRNDFTTKQFLLNISKSSDKKILIFPGTTFYETKRSTLEDEVSLYDEYLRYISKKIDFNTILFKPHPGSYNEKIKLISENINFRNHINNEIDIYKNISNLPLEILVDILLNLNKNLKIYLPICSSGSLSTLIVFPDRIYALKAFGKKLIRKYIDEKYVNPRIEQEVSISENLKKLGFKFLASDCD